MSEIVYKKYKILVHAIAFNIIVFNQQKLNNAGAALGRGQTLYFTWAEWNANEKNPLFSLIYIRFGSCEVQRLTRVLVITIPSF